MKFLVIVQDLKTSGTSEGIVSRSFLGKLRKSYPGADIKVVYLKNMESEDQLELLPVNSIEEIHLRRSPPKFIKILNRIYWRVCNTSLNDRYQVRQYRHHIKKIECSEYDHIFIRSAGNNFETILACRDLPILKRAIINFHDPYPQGMTPDSGNSLTGLDFNKQERMREVVQQAKGCMTPSQTLSEDMQYLYRSEKKFHTLPHQYDPAVFDTFPIKRKTKRKKRVVISYQGAVQLGRNLNILLDAYLALLEKEESYRETTEFLLRITGPYSKEIIEKHQQHPNLVFLGQVPFSKSFHELKYETDIAIILENCSERSNILPGKVAVIASLQKPFLCLSPANSEMRRLLQEPAFVARCDDREEIMQKLEKLIVSIAEGKDFKKDTFERYFNEESFRIQLKQILQNGNRF
jgi:hypothetical protein